MDLQQTIINMCERARNAARVIARTDNEQKNLALRNIQTALRNSIPKILEANAKDYELAKKSERPSAYLDRLLLTESRLKSTIESITDVIELPDYVGRELARWKVPSGLEIIRKSVPLGVIGIIYESRPNVTCDASALCIKSGNAAILRTGSDSLESAKVMMDCIQEGLKTSGLPVDVCQLISVKDREAVDILIQQDRYIDVIIPRGGISLISNLASKSKIPLFKHLAGVCHTYIHKDADPKKACEVAFNAKMRRTGVCGATETILVDDAVVESHLPQLIRKLKEAQCEIRGDERIRQLDPSIKEATEEDWSTEYLDAIVSIKAVKDIDEAIAHIEQYGTHHTEAIITENMAAAAKFHQGIDSAITIQNASTQFADGGEFGMGMEIGISTGRLHARGPVGVEQLTTHKYEVIGHGEIRK